MKRIHLLVLSFILLISGCASNDTYRTLTNLCVYSQAGDCSMSSLQVSNDDEYHLGFVEYDDQGQLRDVQQQKQLINYYNKLASEGDVILLTFVHGWHHSAAPGDENVEKFRQILSEVSKNEAEYSKKHEQIKRKVLGVYVGWRGDSIDVEYLNVITFWDRKSTAHDIGQQGITSLLLDLEEIVNVHAGIKGEADSSRMVVIGHSFGGAVLFDSVKKILADRFVNSVRGKTETGIADGFSDLVVLINPAFEALRYSSLFDLSQRGCRSYFTGQLPKLAVMTSETDYATKLAFPFGRFFSTFFETHKTVKRHYCQTTGSAGKVEFDFDEGEADRTTIGHYDNYKTHRLEPVDKPMLKLLSNTEIQSAWFSQKEKQSIELFEHVKLLPKDRAVALNPYLNIEVDERIMDGHNDIWSKEVIGFIQDLIRLSITPVK